MSNREEPSVGEEISSNADHKSGTLDKKKNYRRDKPWDTDDIDKWKVLQVEPEDKIEPFLECSSFATLFPKYREVYLRNSWPEVTKGLSTLGIACELNLIEGSMTVKTTRKTRDPYSIFKARDLIKLLARSVPLAQAMKIFEEGMFCDIIKIGKIIRNNEKFAKRRQRLIGPEGNTLKAIELLTKCYVLVQGNTVACMGSFKGLKIVRRIVVDCIKNIHPIYHIKELMIKRELEKDPKLKNENWSRFLPNFKNRRTKSKKIKKKKNKSVFPPPQTPRKIDLQIESGEYFLTEQEKNKIKLEKKKKASKENSEKKRGDLLKAYKIPKGSPKKASIDIDTNEIQPQMSLSKLKSSLKNTTSQKSASLEGTPSKKNTSLKSTSSKKKANHKRDVSPEDVKAPLSTKKTKRVKIS